MTGGETRIELARYADDTEIINRLPHAYIEFVRFCGADTASPVLVREEIRGNVFRQIEQAETFADLNILRPMVIGGARHVVYPNYSLGALRQFIRNAVMHRDYELPAPIKVHWFDDRVEIISPGGVYGRADANIPEGFTAYHNPAIAESLNAAKIAQRFGFGIPFAEKAMKDNGNPPPEYDIDNGHFRVTLRPAKLPAAREH